MSHDELAAELYRKQGFMVISQNEPDPIGFIWRNVSGTGFAYKIVAHSNEQEYLNQCHEAHVLAPDITSHPSTYKTKRYFYRIEAAD